MFNWLIYLRRARREGYCDSKRVRPKMFEVAKIGGSFYDNNPIDAKQPDVLKRPGPIAKFQTRSYSIWNGKGNMDGLFLLTFKCLISFIDYLLKIYIMFLNLFLCGLLI